MTANTAWERKRLKYFVDRKTHKARVERSSHYVGLENVEPWTGRYLATEAEIETESSQFRCGDILFGKLRPYLAKVYVAQADGTCTSEMLVLRPRKGVVKQFLFYRLVSADFIDLVNSTTFGSKMPRADWEQIGNLSVALPAQSEQARVVSLLDRETSEIDALVEKKQRLIKLLDEERQALISHAVTHGLNPNAQTKDSVADWLGRVPAHWNVAPLKFLADVQSGITVGKKYDADATLVARPYLRVANVQDGYLDLENITSIEVPLNDVEQYELQSGDVVVTEGGDFDKLARGYVWGGQIAGCLHQNHIFAVRPRQSKLRSAFLSALMTSLYGRNYFTATSVQSTNLACTNRSKLGGFPIPLPPPEEQDAICQGLESSDARFQQTTQQLRSTIERLREYRSALITAAVTGQLDLREHEKKMEALV